MKRSILFFSLVVVKAINAAFAPTTIIHTSHGLAVIHELEPDARLVSPIVNNPGEVVLKQIKHKGKRLVSTLVAITVASETIVVTPDQLVYLPTTQTWVPANTLSAGQMLLTYQGIQVSITSVEEIAHELKTIVVSIGLPHTLAIGTAGIVMHNALLVAAVVLYYGFVEGPAITDLPLSKTAPDLISSIIPPPPPTMNYVGVAFALNNLAILPCTWIIAAYNKTASAVAKWFNKKDDFADETIVTLEIETPLSDMSAADSETESTPEIKQKRWLKRFWEKIRKLWTIAPQKI